MNRAFRVIILAGPQSEESEASDTLFVLFGRVHVEFFSPRSSGAIIFSSSQGGAGVMKLRRPLIVGHTVRTRFL